MKLPIPRFDRTFPRLLACFLLALAGANKAQAECRTWNVDGRWHFMQSNNAAPRIDLKRSGNVLTGSAWVVIPGDLPIAAGGSIDGTINGDRIELSVYWESGAVGVYSGRINPSGLMQGDTFDRNNPQDQASWSSDRNASCQFDPDEISNGKPVMALGRVQPASLPAACAQWAVEGDWNFFQGNGLGAFLKLQQQGAALSGTGTGGRDLTGVAGGRVAGDTIDFTVRWSDGRVGVYSGTISPLGRLQGTTYPVDNPGERTAWSSDGKAVCQSTVQPKPVGFGRVTPRDASKPLPTLCEAAITARSRNSPNAPALEERCRLSKLAASPQPTPEPLVDRAELDRLAALGHSIASQDYALGSLRRSNSDPLYRFGFDIATALFGDPAMGAQGITALGPAQLNIRASLEPAGQVGFDDSKNFHLSRTYAH